MGYAAQQRTFQALFFDLEARRFFFFAHLLPLQDDRNLVDDRIYIDPLLLFQVPVHTAEYNATISP